MGTEITFVCIRKCDDCRCAIFSDDYCKLMNVSPRDKAQRVIVDEVPADLQHAGKLFTMLSVLRRDAAHCDVLLQAEGATSNAASETADDAAGEAANDAASEATNDATSEVANGAAGEACGEWAHRAVLAAASPHFCALFNSSFQECKKLVVVIKDVEPEILRALIENIYFPTSLMATIEKAVALLAAATVLEVGDVRDAACAFLAESLTVDNAFGIHASAKQHACTDLVVATTRYIHEHAERVLAGDQLLEAAPDALIALLDSDKLAAKEEVVFDAVLRWTRHNLQERQRHLSSLLQVVRLALVPRSVLAERSRIEPLASAEASALRQVIEALAADRKQQAELLAYTTQPPATLFVMGGLEDSNSSSAMVCSLPRGRWQSVASLPVSCSRAGAALIDGRVYLVGGWDGSASMRTVFIYDPASDSWLSGPPLNRARRWLAVTAMDNRLYAGGGWHDVIPGFSWMVSDSFMFGTTLNSMEAMDPREGVWRYIASMPTRRRSFGLAAMGGKLYSVGGFDNFKNPVKTTERYDPSAGRWETVEALLERRQYFGVGVVDHTIYAVGGYDGSTSLRSMERYRVDSGWESAPPLPTARRSLTVTAHGSRVYAVGGNSGNNPLTNVCVFDPATGDWRELPPLPVGRYMAAAVVVPWMSPSVR